MIRDTLVKADVADISDSRWDHCPPPKRIALDANALYFFSYTNFGTLRDLGAKNTPNTRQLRQYGGWLRRALNAKSEFFTTIDVMGELVETMEHSELYCEYLRKGYDSSSFNAKEFRYNEQLNLTELRDRVRVLTESAKRSLRLVFFPKSSPDSAFNLTLKEWIGSHADWFDSSLGRAAVGANICHILSDDQDMATLSGITLYTANRNTVIAAGDAGKLIEPPDEEFD